MSIDTNPEKINEILDRGVEEVIEKDSLEKKLKSGKKLRIKLGIDPTSPDLHLGHSIVFNKLKQFQELGHQVIFLIGDFTARIGDPSGRIEARKPLTEKEIRKNMANYEKQASKLLDMKGVEVRHNSEWYEKKKASFVAELTSRFTFARLIERDDFKKRIEKDLDITILELFYPLLQGYDSVELKADLEIGGTDQKFNLLMGRKVQKKYGQPEQDIMTLSLLMGTDGKRKMSKSFGNYIGSTESSEKMYGKIMSIPDTAIWHYFKLLTNIPLKEIEKMRGEVYNLNLNPRIAKAQLAKEIVAMYYDQKTARQAEQEFNKVFRDKKMPSQMPEFKTDKKSMLILDLLFDAGLAESKSRAKKLVLEKAVKINQQIIDDWKKEIKLENDMVIQAGRRKFLKIKK